MPVVEKETVVMPTTDGGAGGAVAVFVGLIILAVIGYMIYAYNGGSTPSVIERNTNTSTTIHDTAPAPAPVQIPVPAAPAAPAPAPSPSDSGSNQ